MTGEPNKYSMADIPWGEYGDSVVNLFPSGSIFKGFQVGLGATTNLLDASLDLNIMSISALLIDCKKIPDHVNQSEIIIS
jgi:hypothetical protein